MIGKDTNEQKEILDDLHERLAHLSLRRLDKTTIHKGFEWATVMKLAPKTLVAFERFVSELRMAHPERARWFTDKIPPEELAR